jgi:hypothetical protein
MRQRCLNIQPQAYGSVNTPNGRKFAGGKLVHADPIAESPGNTVGSQLKLWTRRRGRCSRFNFCSTATILASILRTET